MISYNYYTTLNNQVFAPTVPYLLTLFPPFRIVSVVCNYLSVKLYVDNYKKKDLEPPVCIKFLKCV